MVLVIDSQDMRMELKVHNIYAPTMIGLGFGKKSLTRDGCIKVIDFSKDI